MKECLISAPAYSSNNGLSNHHDSLLTWRNNLKLGFTVLLFCFFIQVKQRKVNQLSAKVEQTNLVKPVPIKLAGSSG